MIGKYLKKIPSPLTPTVSLYIFREVCKGIVTTSIVFCCGLLFIEHLQFFVDLIVSKGTPLRIVLKLVFYTISFTFPLIIPVGTLFGVMLVMGDLSGNSEIIAMKSVGIPMRQVFYPMIAIGFLATGLSLFHTNVILPETNHRYMKVYTRIHYSNPTMMMRERVFSTLGTKQSKKISYLITGPDGKTMQSVIICDQSDKKETKILLAQKGNWTSNDFNSDLVMELSEGKTIVVPKQESRRDSINVSDFEKMEVHIPDESRKYSRVNRSLREIGAAEIWKRIQYLKKQGSYVSNSYYIEFHRKFAIPTTCIFFVFLGIPLGMVYSRSGREESYGIGVMTVVVYYIIMNITSVFASYQLFIPSGLWIWIPNILTGLVAILITILRFSRT